MRFLLRLLLLLVLSSFLLRHYGFFLAREPLAYVFGRERRTPEPSSWDNQGSSARGIGGSEPAAWSVAAPRPDARSDRIRALLKATSETPSVGEATRRL